MASFLSPRIRNGLIISISTLLVGIFSVFAGPPDNGPGGIPPGGKFAIYFGNMIAGTGSTGTCPSGQVIVGFNTGSSLSYGEPICRTVSAYWTYSGTVLFYTGGNVGIGTTTPLWMLDVGGNVRATGAVLVYSGLSVSGVTFIGNTFTVTGGTSLRGVLGVSGSTIIGNALTVTGNTNLQALTTVGATTIGNAFTVTGGTSLRGVLGVSGSTLIGNALTVTGGTSLQGSLGVSGATVLMGNLRIALGGASGYVLVSDTSGNATWQAPAISLPTANTGETLRYTGTGWIANSFLYNDGNNIGLGVYDNTFLSGGIYNIAIGGQYPGASMIGYYNLALGGNTAGNGMNGTRNVALGGNNAGQSMTGSMNTALGGNTPGYMLSGTYQLVGGGANAGWMSAGSHNTILGGSNAGVYMNGIYNSVFGGSYAGLSMSGFQNTAIGGEYTGNGMLGSGNLALGGRNATITNNSVQYSVVIGSGAYSNQSGAIILGGSGSNIGIGIPNPAYKLDVNGTGNFLGIRFPTGAASGYVLTTDASGNARWVPTQTASWQNISLGNTAAFDPLCQYQVRFREYGTGIYLQNLYASGNVWVNAERVSENFLSLLFLNAAPQLSYGVPASNKGQYGYRSSDTGFFVNMPEYPIQEMRMLCGVGGSGTGLTEIDPKIGSLTLNYIPKWDGSTLSNGSLYNTSTGIGIGTIAPNASIEINGGMRLNTVTARPTCNSSQRGVFWYTQGGAGVKDAVEVCAKDAADLYAWRTLY